MTDKELIELVRKQDSKGFETLYKIYYKRLYLLAFKYLRKEETAQEVVNDVFLKIWTDPALLNQIQSPGPYLSRCIVNNALNLISREKKQHQKQEQFLMGFQEEEHQSDEALVLEQQLQQLEMALDQLPPQCKKVMMMSKFDKFKQQEIADRLNISIKTVKNHLTQGYEKIRVILSKEQVFLLFLFFNQLFR